jgi:hypothetical protein
VYIDDILVTSKKEEEHLKHLHTVCERLASFNILINCNKCVFGQREIRFLGHIVSASGIRPTPEKIEAITNFPRPETVKQLRQFLGLINFYRNFIPKVASHQAPLHAVLTPKTKSKATINWTPEMAQAFTDCKQSLSTATLLAHPVIGVDLALSTDASDFSIGACLQQRVKNDWQPLAFFSRKLTPAQTKYSVYDRELYAVYAAIKYFRHMLEGQTFFILTDHKPLTFAFAQKPEKCTPRQFRHLDHQLIYHRCQIRPRPREHPRRHPVTHWKNLLSRRLPCPQHGPRKRCRTAGISSPRRQHRPPSAKDHYPWYQPDTLLRHNNG